MTGPPTPPPMSATEMADEARTLPPPTPVEATPVPDPPPASPPQPKQPLQDSYQLLFPTLSNLVYHHDYRQLIAISERGDLKVCWFSTPIMHCSDS